ncbi:MAG: FG-GAP-like repeat-containing protein [Pseudomonadota bacterium]
MDLLRACIVVLSCLISLFAHSIQIDTDRYDIYFGDVNGDGFTDVYFHGKERFVPIAGDIVIPIILQAPDSFALIREYSRSDQRIYSGDGDTLTRINRTLTANNRFSDPEFITMTDSEIAGLRAAVNGQDYFSGDFNGDKATDFLLRGINDRSSNFVYSGKVGSASLYTRRIINGEISVTIGSTDGDAPPRLLQHFTNTSFATANINTAGIQITDLDGDGRDDIILNQAGKQSTWFAKSNGQIDLTAYQQGASAPKPAHFTGTSAGEFKVNENGAANYTIKLPLPVGTAGVQADIALAYASNAGNTLLGKGWSLNGLSAIARCRQTKASDGQNQPIQWNANDRFCLDGQRLILVEGAAYGAPGSLYKTELDSYVKVMAVGGSTGRPASFKALHKDGSVRFYGATGNARQRAGNHTLAWAQNRIEDSVGNAINFQYHNDSAGHRIKHIHYAYGSSSAAHNAEIVFHYDDRPDTIAGYIGGYLVKTSKRLESIHIRSRINGKWSDLRRFDLYYAPISVDNPSSLLAAVQECVGHQCMQATRFDWQQHAIQPRYVGHHDIHATDPPNGGDKDILLDQKMFDINGDGLLDVAILNTDDSGHKGHYQLHYYLSTGNGFEQAHFIGDDEFLFLRELALIPEDRYQAVMKLQPIDYNGDGRQDLAIYRSRGHGYWTIHLSMPTDKGWRLSASPIKLTHLSNKHLVFADVNGDGLADAVSANSLYYLERNPSGNEAAPYAYLKHISLSAPQFGASLQCGNTSEGGSVVKRSNTYVMTPSTGDFDGDGDMDFIASRYQTCTSKDDKDRQSTKRSEQFALVEWTGSGFTAKQTLTGLSSAIGHNSAQLIDINGDGLADIVRSADDNRQWYYRLSTGAGLTGEKAVGTFSKFADTHFADVDGDGRQDVIFQDISDGHLKARLYDGARFGPIRTIVARAASKKDTLGLVDMNGDSRLDYTRLYQVGTQKTFLRVHFTQAGTQAQHTITKITNGLGAETDIHYESLAHSAAYSTADFELSYLYRDWGSNPGAAARGSCGETGCTNLPKLSTGRHFSEFERRQQIDMVNGIWDLPNGAQTLNNNEPILPINGALYVVSRVDSSAPAANASPGAIRQQAKSSVAYQYSGARAQAAGRGYLGFQYLKTIDLQTNIKTVTLYRQDYPFTGAPQKTVTFSPDNKPMQVSENTWAFVARPAADGSTYYQTLLRKAEERGYRVNSKTDSDQLTVWNQLIKQVTTANRYDPYGNLTSTVATTQGFGSDALKQVKTTENKYTGGNLYLPSWGRTSRYAELGRLSHASVTSHRNGRTSTRTTAFDYYTSGNLVGLLKTEIIEPNGDRDKTLSTTHYYDSMGNTQRIVTRGWNGTTVGNRSARTVYDDSGRFVNARYNHYNQRINAVLDRDQYGSPSRTMDSSGITTTLNYDALGRETRRSDNTGAWVNTAYLRCHQVSYCPAGTHYAIRKTLAGGGQSVEYFDLMGRSIRKGAIDFDGRWVFEDTEYDRLSRAVHSSLPFYANTLPLWNRTHYDILGRPYRIHMADGSVSSIHYSGFEISTTNALGQRKVERNNALEQRVSVTDHLNGRIAYEYNIDGELTFLKSYRSADDAGKAYHQTIDASAPTLASVTELQYDSLGRKQKMIDPDKGTWTYRYNAFGELIAQTDANKHSLSQHYDALGRMVKRTDRRSNGSVEAHTVWVYDNSQGTGPEIDNGRGQLRQVIMSQSTGHESCYSASTQQCITYSYDEYGRELSRDIGLQQGTRDLGRYTTRIDYDHLGRVDAHYDVLDGVVRKKGKPIVSGTRTLYNRHGFAYQTRDLQTGTLLHHVESHNARGQVTEALKGNGARSYYNYDHATGRLTNQRTDVAGLNAIQDIQYRWDQVGNLRYRHNQSANTQGGQKNLQESFCYDGLNRLIKTNRGTTRTAACGGLNTNQQDIQYDSLGNIIRKHDVGTYTYAHSNNTAAANDAGLHAVTSTSDGVRYRYDNNGNMTAYLSGNTTLRSLVYTTFDKPSKITKGGHTTRFAYGHDRHRYWRQDTDKNGVVTTTLYLDGVERISRSDRSSIQWKRYLGDAIYTVTTNARDQQQSLDPLFVYKDHLGSTDLLTNASGAVVQSMSFDPWGQRRQADRWQALSALALSNFDNSRSTKGFTGHEHLDKVGLIHMNGRIYDPRLARFLQADPHIQAPDNTQSLNRYSYVINNPLNKTDPSGYFFTMIVGFALAATSIGGIQAVVTLAWAAMAQATYQGARPEDILKAGVITGVSAYAFIRIGQSFSQDSNANIAADFGGPSHYYHFGGNYLTSGQIARQITAHSFAGGVIAKLQGGQFGHGFFSAGFTKGVMGAANFDYSNRNRAVVAGRTAVAAMVGGTVSEVTGGKFANGARTAAIGHLFNQELSAEAQANAQKADTQPVNEGGCAAPICKAYQALYNSLTQDQQEALTSAINGAEDLDNVYFHYTDRNGYRGIIGSQGVIAPGADGLVYLTTDMLSPSEVHNSLYMGAPGYEGKGSHIFALEVFEGVPLRPGTQPNEVTHAGALRNGRHVKFLYGGKNPIE